MKAYSKIILLLFLFISFTTFAQEEVSEEPVDQPKTKKELKQEKKAAKKAKKKEAALATTAKSNALIVSKQWVLEATQIQGRKGQTFQLDPSINFVYIIEDQGTIQLSFNSIVGWNGIGGVTLDGKIISYEIREPKKEGQGASVVAQFRGPGVNARMQLNVRGEYGDVTLNGTFSNNRLVFRGQLVHPSESRVYKGNRTN